jgi:hypothetical protein
MLVCSLRVSRGLCPFLGQGTSDRLRCGLTERYLSRHTEDAFFSGAKRSLLRLPLEFSPSPETAEEPVPKVHLWHSRPKSSTRGSADPVPYTSAFISADRLSSGILHVSFSDPYTLLPMTPATARALHG